MKARKMVIFIPDPIIAVHIPNTTIRATCSRLIIRPRNLIARVIRYVIQTHLQVALPDFDLVNLATHHERIIIARNILVHLVALRFGIQIEDLGFVDTHLMHATVRAENIQPCPHDPLIAHLDITLWLLEGLMPSYMLYFVELVNNHHLMQNPSLA